MWCGWMVRGAFKLLLWVSLTWQIPQKVSHLNTWIDFTFFSIRTTGISGVSLTLMMVRSCYLMLSHLEHSNSLITILSEYLDIPPQSS